MNARTLIPTLLVPAMLALAAPAAAQWHGHGGGAPGCHAGHGGSDPAQVAQRWQMRAQRLSSRLSLDARQQQLLQTIVRDELVRFQQRVAPLVPRTPERRAAREALMQDFDARFSAILTPAQSAQWGVLKEEIRQRRAERHGHHGQGGADQGGGSDEDRLGI